MLTQEKVKELFDYDSRGYLIWKSVRDDGYKSHREVGAIAGTQVGLYLRVSIDSVKYTVHRLIWFWHHGYWPKNTDHINGNTLDNRIENLRECNAIQNQGNAGWSTMRGIEKHGRKYRVRITGSGWKKELGSFETLEEALAARDAGHREYFGEFARE